MSHLDSGILVASKMVPIRYTSAKYCLHHLGVGKDPGLAFERLSMDYRGLWRARNGHSQPEKGFH